MREHLANPGLLSDQRHHLGQLHRDLPPLLRVHPLDHLLNHLQRPPEARMHVQLTSWQQSRSSPRKIDGVVEVPPRALTRAAQHARPTDLCLLDAAIPSRR